MDSSLTPDASLTVTFGQFRPIPEQGLLLEGDKPWPLPCGGTLRSRSLCRHRKRRVSTIFLPR